MIVQGILDLLFGLVDTLFAWMASVLPDAPTWVEELGAALVSVVDIIPASVRWFVPLGPALTVGASLVGLFLIAGSLRLVRRVLSLISGGGGNA